jgi:hypothetical protein
VQSAATEVDIASIRLIEDRKNTRAEAFEQVGCERGRGAVSAIHDNGQPAKGTCDGRSEE